MQLNLHPTTRYLHMNPTPLLLHHYIPLPYTTKPLYPYNTTTLHLYITTPLHIYISLIHPYIRPLHPTSTLDLYTRPIHPYPQCDQTRTAAHDASLLASMQMIDTLDYKAKSSTFLDNCKVRNNPQYTTIALL